MDRIYCYKDSEVLINKLGITDQERLMDFERRLTMLRLLEIFDHPIEGEFDFAHLKEIHRYIFQDIYEWAGQTRTVDIGKGNMFCRARFIEGQASEIFGNLKKENFLTGMGKKEFAKRLAYYFSEINALHPFREGNGRTQREFVRLLALKNGFIISFGKVTPDEMLEASKSSFLCDYSKMEDLFMKCIDDGMTM